jgi:methionine-rich copper-binding protein CopC
VKQRTTSRALPICLVLLLVAATAATALDAVRMDPEREQTLTRPPQHLRLFFDAAPDPAKSQVTLRGPEGELKLEGLHTMGENDLMIRIVGRVADGAYAVHWKAVGTDGSTSEGEWKFTVKRGG